MTDQHAAPKEESGYPLTQVDHWNSEWGAMPSARFWSMFDPGISDAFKLLSKHISPGSSVLEIGFAPGKYLAWAALKRHAKVSGIDYSTQGVAVARKFFDTLGIEGDLRNEDVFATTFGPNNFDCVYSNGVIEHFEDPRPIVRKHLDLAKPGGTVVITFPNYGGVFGRLQASFDPDNLSIHNLGIMSPAAARSLFDGLEIQSLKTFCYGRPAVSLVSLERVLPRKLAVGIKRGVAIAGQLVPRPLSPLRPMICAVAVKAESA